jgi:hypothetical protein
MTTTVPEDGMPAVMRSGMRIIIGRMSMQPGRRKPVFMKLASITAHDSPVWSTWFQNPDDILRVKMHWARLRRDILYEYSQQTLKEWMSASRKLRHVLTTEHLVGTISSEDMVAFATMWASLNDYERPTRPSEFDEPVVIETGPATQQPD